MFAEARSARRWLVWCASSFGALLLYLCFAPLSAHAAAGVNQEINFQGRLLNAQGATVPDGNYNIEFKIYQDGDGQSVGDTTGSPAGTLEWTEDYLNNNSQGVTVQDGYFSVQLGSITQFGSNVDWDQDTLWLSMNVAGTGTSCSTFAACSPDGEMLPMKRLTADPYALDSSLLGGLSSSQFIQFAQGLQTDASDNTSIYLNKTGTGNIIDLQSDGNEAFTITNSGDETFGANGNHTISVATAPASTAGMSLTVAAGAAGSGSSALAGGNLTLEAGAGGGTNGNGGNVIINAGLANGSGANGTVSIGTANTAAIQIGDTADAVTQTIGIGDNAGGGTTNVTIGSGTAAAAGTTTLQAKDEVIIALNGVDLGTFDGDLYLGNGITASAPNDFTISGTGSSAATVNGGSLTIQGGDATSGNADGGSLLLTGGAGSGSGSNGLVVLSTPTFQTATDDPNCYTGGALVVTSCTIATSTVDDYSAAVVGFSTEGQTATLPAPTITTPGRVFYIAAAPSSEDFTLSVNSGGTGNEVAMRQNTSATMVWNGTAWGAAGASSSTDLQAAYDNTLQSAGGAELVVSHTSDTNGLTIRDSSVDPVNGPLVSIQTDSAATLFSVNSNVTEYASDAGAETDGSSSSTFPAGTWSGVGAATVSRYTTVGSYIATGQGSVSTQTTTAAGDGVANTLDATLTANQHYDVSFAARLYSGTFTNMAIYYSANGTADSVPCTTSQTPITSGWTKINCSFAAPASGITANNAILIEQTDGTARTFYIDNLSVTIAADYNYATDGGVDDAADFTTNWPAVGSATVTRSTSIGNDASDSAQVVTTGANQGVSNLLSVAPLANSLYRVTVYAASTTSGFDDFTVSYTPNGGTNSIGCVDYSTQTVSSSTTAFTEITCYIQTDGTAVTAPYLDFTQTDSTARTFYVDTLSATLATDTTPNVQIGGGVDGGPTTLLTLDSAASAPIASNNESLLGSMYYDTTLGKIQCYEASGWGSCGSSPDTIVTISPEYTNAVMHGTGVGTMTSDICSDVLHINDGTSGQPTICGTDETYNFYKWTSPQASGQTYSIYVTYQLPETFKGFTSGQTSVMGRTDSSDSTVQYEVYREDPSSGLAQCGPTMPVSSGSVSSWQTGVADGAADPSTCGFAPGDSIVFKIDVIASQNADAYVGNLNFTFSNN